MYNYLKDVPIFPFACTSPPSVIVTNLSVLSEYRALSGIVAAWRASL